MLAFSHTQKNVNSWTWDTWFSLRPTFWCSNYLVLVEKNCCTSWLPALPLGSNSTEWPESPVSGLKSSISFVHQIKHNSQLWGYAFFFFFFFPSGQQRSLCWSGSQTVSRWFHRKSSCSHLNSSAQVQSRQCAWFCWKGLHFSGAPQTPGGFQPKVELETWWAQDSGNWHEIPRWERHVGAQAFCKPQTCPGTGVLSQLCTPGRAAQFSLLNQGPILCFNVTSLPLLLIRVSSAPNSRSGEAAI